MKGRSLLGVMMSFVLLGAGALPVQAQIELQKSLRSSYPLKKINQPHSDHGTGIEISSNSKPLLQLYVSASSECVDSGIDISSGELLRFSASGRASYGYEGEPVNEYPQTDANGNRLVNGNNIGEKLDSNAQMPNHPIGVLIGRIGRNGSFVAIGSSNQLMMRESGRLFLCYNDVPDMFGNNGGGYTVSISRIETGSENPTNPSFSSEQSTTAIASTILQRQGVLENGDSVMSSDGSLYDIYTFEGRAGQSVTIILESGVFDPYLVLLDPDHQKIGENDDLNSNSRNSGLTVTLPKTGTYKVVVNGYDRNSRGAYTVTVNTPQPIVTARSPSSNQQSARPQVPTWREFVEQGGNRSIQFDYDLPDEFKNGYVYFYYGVSVITAYIFKQDLSSYPEPRRDISSQIDNQLGDRYVNSGQAIRLFWSMGAYGSQYANDTRVRFGTQPGNGCFKITCLIAPFMSNAEISRILLSERAIGESTQQTASERSPSSGQQAATAPPRSTRQTFRNVQELGRAQFLQGNQEVIAAYEALQGAAQGQYNVVEIPSNDFMDNPFTQIARERGTFFGDREDISYGDYLKLKLKLNAQIAAYNNSLVILEKMQDYNNRLSNENRQGGREVSQRIVANFNSFWSQIEQQNRSPSLSLGRIISVLAYALEETRVSTQSFVLKAVQTGGKLAAAFNNFGRLSQLLNLPGSSNANATQFTGRGLDYATTLNEKLNDFEREFNAGNYEKLTDINLEIANATIGFLDPQNNPRLVRVGQAIAIRSEATKLRDLMILLQQPNGGEFLDDYDRFYLTVAGISSALKIGSDAVTLINPNPQQSPSQIAAKIKAINDLLFEGLQIDYKEELRRKYERLVFHNTQLQNRVSGLSSSINYAAQQVGEYLLESRVDAVTRRADGTIAVSIDGVLYPPNSP